MSRRTVGSALVILLVALGAGCSGAGSTESPVSSAAPPIDPIATTSPDGTSTVGSSVTCREPPPSELEAVSPIRLAVEPNPAVAGAEATLSVPAEGLGPDALIGAGATWTCWDGEEWVATHQIVRGPFYRGRPATLEVEPGATTTIAAVGLTVPDSSPILIPEVGAGIYRIEDVISKDGAEAAGFVLVEVRSLVANERSLARVAS